MRRLLTVILALGVVAGAAACSDDSSDEATAPEEVSDAGGETGGGAGDGSTSFCSDVVTKLMYLSQQSEEQFAEDVTFIEANIDDVGAEVRDAVTVIVEAEKAALSGDTSLRLVAEYDEAQTTIAEYRADSC